jgi:uncharacterized membrane protein YbhN (UPF0104 family)
VSIKLVQSSDRKRVILLIVALLTLYVLVPRLSSFRNSFTTLLKADFVYIGLSIIFWLATFSFAALVYKLIAQKPLLYWRTLFIQLASGFTNRLAPLGAGAIAINTRYLVKSGHTPTQAGALVALNNLLGFIGNAILLLAAIIFRPDSIYNTLKIHIKLSEFLVVIISLCLLFGLIIITVIGSKLIHKIRQASMLLLQSVFQRPGRLFLALLASMAITAGYTLVLYAMGLAFNVHISIIQSLVVLTLGVLAATITPTPGGVGGAEAGLVAGLISINVTSHQALTVALTYRFLVYWLPILPGLAAFQFALRRRYI